VRSTTELSDSGRDGSAGVAAEPAVFIDEGVAAEFDVGIAAEEGVKAMSRKSVKVRAGARSSECWAKYSKDVPDDEAARPLSHGFGGDGVAISYQIGSSEWRRMMMSLCDPRVLRLRKQ
jgi:hypothetical protein